MGIFASAGFRLIVRAMGAGLMAGILWVQQHGTTHAAVMGALVAAGWAFIEYVSPVNQTVGAGKHTP